MRRVCAVQAAALQPPPGQQAGGPAVPCVVASDRRGLVVLGEHLSTSDVLPEGPGSKGKMCPMLCPPPWLGTYMGVGT